MNEFFKIAGGVALGALFVYGVHYLVERYSDPEEVEVVVDNTTFTADNLDK